MTEVVIIHRTPMPDPLARDEQDLVERLHAMAEDALAKKHEGAVKAEAQRFRELVWGDRAPSSP